MTDDPDSPTPFGRYELVRLLAAGGMGELWLGRMRGAAGWEKAVAIKKILPHLHDNDEFLDRFIDEARIAGELSHGNIVPVFDMGVVDGEHYIAMEYVDGWDLRRILRHLSADGLRLPDAFALFVAAEVCRGLAHAHEKVGEDGECLGIVHRDVSPANVLVSRSGEVKLTDFGIASARSRLTRTLTGQLKGKLSYMSPEQAAGEPLDARSDLFALGAILFEMLTGVRAFDGDSDLEVLAKVQRGEHPALGDLRPDLDPEVAAIVNRVMAVDRNERYEDADALQLDLVRALFRDTGPITHRSFSEYLATRMKGAVVPGVGAQGLDALLNAQLDAAGSRTPSVRPLPEPVRPAEATGTIAVPARSPRQRRARARQRSLLALVGVVAIAVSAAVWLRPGPTMLSVTSEPDGAQVFVDGVPVGVTTMRASIEPGSHVVRVGLEGYAAYQAEVRVHRGDDVTVEAELEPAPAHVVFESTPPGATVTVAGGTPFVAGADHLVPVGRPVELTMSLPGYEPLEEVVVIEVGQSRLARRLEPVEVAADGGSQASAEVDPADAGSGATVERSDDTRPTQPTPRVERVTFRLVGIPDDARVQVDGRDVRGDRIELERDGAPVDVVVTDASGGVWQRRLDPTQDEPGSVQVEFTPVVPGSLHLHFGGVPAVGELSIDDQPFVPVDGSDQFSLPPGEHRIVVRNTTHQTRHEATIDVRSGEETLHVVQW